MVSLIDGGGNVAALTIQSRCGQRLALIRATGRQAANDSSVEAKSKSSDGVHDLTTSSESYGEITGSSLALWELRRLLLVFARLAPIHDRGR
jgi:hypothetical protein